MNESKILTSDEVAEIEARQPVITTDDEGITVHRVQLSLAERDALCSTVRHLLSENEALAHHNQLCEKAFELEDALRLPEVGNLNALQVVKKMAELHNKNERLTRERNEALDQCAELHRKISGLNDHVKDLNHDFEAANEHCEEYHS